MTCSNNFSYWLCLLFFNLFGRILLLSILFLFILSSTTTIFIKGKSEHSSIESEHFRTEPLFVNSLIMQAYLDAL